MKILIPGNLKFSKYGYFLPKNLPNEKFWCLKFGKKSKNCNLSKDWSKVTWSTVPVLVFYVNFVFNGPVSSRKIIYLCICVIIASAA